MSLLDEKESFIGEGGVSSDSENFKKSFLVLFKDAHRLA